MIVKYEIKDNKSHDVFYIYTRGYYHWSYNQYSEFDVLYNSYDNVNYQDFSGKLKRKNYDYVLDLLNKCKYGISETKYDKIYIDNKEIIIEDDDILDYIYKLKYDIFYGYIDSINCFV